MESVSMRIIEREVSSFISLFKESLNNKVKIEKYKCLLRFDTLLGEFRENSTKKFKSEFIYLYMNPSEHTRNRILRRFLRLRFGITRPSYINLRRIFLPSTRSFP